MKAILLTSLHELLITHLHLFHLRIHRQPHNRHRQGRRQDQGPKLRRARHVETLCAPMPSTVEIVAPNCANMDYPCYNTSVKDGRAVNALLSCIELMSK